MKSPDVLRIALVALALVAPHAAKAQVYVSPSGNDANSGFSKTAPKRTIQAAVNLGVNAVIYVAEGVYPENVTVTARLILDGGYSTDFSEHDPSRHPSVIDGGGSGATVRFGLYASPMIRGFTVRNGEPGIYVENAYPIIQENLITQNVGGGIVSIDSTPYIVGNRVEDNYSPGDGAGMLLVGAAGVGFVWNNQVRYNRSDRNVGGISLFECASCSIIGNTVVGNTCARYFGAGIGVFNTSDASMSIWNNLVSGNAALGEYGSGAIAVFNDHTTSLSLYKNAVRYNTGPWHGGGIYLSGCSGQILQNVVDHNHSDGYGGGIYCFYPRQLTFYSNRITDNETGLQGGGMYVDYFSGNGYAAIIANNLLAHNTAHQYGGGITIANGGPFGFFNNTVADNTGDLGIGGVSVYHARFQSGWFSSNIIAFNTNGGLYNNSQDTNDYVEMRNDDFYGNTGYDYAGNILPWSGNLFADPQFVNRPLDYHLQRTSPVIDQGLTEMTEWYWLSQDGLPRNLGAAVDMGAYEYAQDVTAQVSIPSRAVPVQNKQTGYYDQKVILRNTTKSPIYGPIILALDDLTPGVELVGPAGIDTSKDDPSKGSPYLVLDVGPDKVLSIGEIVTVTLSFRADSTQAIAYKALVLAPPSMHP